MLCPFCKDPLNEGATVCRSCGATYDYAPLPMTMKTFLKLCTAIVGPVFLIVVGAFALLIALGAAVSGEGFAVTATGFVALLCFFGFWKLVRKVVIAIKPGQERAWVRRVG